MDSYHWVTRQVPSESYLSFSNSFGTLPITFLITSLSLLLTELMLFPIRLFWVSSLRKVHWYSSPTLIDKGIFQVCGGVGLGGRWVSSKKARLGGKASPAGGSGGRCTVLSWPQKLLEVIYGLWPVHQCVPGTRPLPDTPVLNKYKDGRPFCMQPRPQRLKRGSWVKPNKMLCSDLSEKKWFKKTSDTL